MHARDRSSLTVKTPVRCGRPARSESTKILVDFDVDFEALFLQLLASHQLTPGEIAPKTARHLVSSTFQKQSTSHKLGPSFERIL